MWQDLEVTVEKAEVGQLKEKPAASELGFGKFFTDYMFQMHWTRENGWYGARICPFQDFSVSPAAMVFHYGQAIFEGMKAYRGKDDQIFLFRAKDNLERMNRSALRMCMPRLPLEMVLKSLKALLYLERDWVPDGHGSSLYIRPTMIADEAMLGVRPASSYRFYIILCPVGAYYPEGFEPTRIFVSDSYVRAVKGGVGEAKTAGNYGASLAGLEEARKKGCTQVLWLDACEYRYVEEVGTSNIFFLLGDRLVTPPLEGSILEGITRNCVITLAQEWGITVEERRIAIDEVLSACAGGALRESFATGTAAVISPIGELHYREERYRINDGKTGELAKRLYDELQLMQYGHKKGSGRGWSTRVC